MLKDYNSVFGRLEELIMWVLLINQKLKERIIFYLNWLMNNQLEEEKMEVVFGLQIISVLTGHIRQHKHIMTVLLKFLKNMM